MSQSTVSAPLEGIRVIDYSHFLAGPYVGRCLAGLGAEVIKVERPATGEAGRGYPYVREGVSGYFLQQNMGKKGLCLNMKDARGKALMTRLVESADVFIENYRPGALGRLGLGYDEVSALNPRLVYCSISAYGHTGPDSHRPGFGLIAEAKSGIMAMVGSPGEAPPLLRIALGDMYTGSHAVSAICAALLGRVKSGRGQHIDLALYDCLMSMHEYAVQCYTLSNGREVPQQTGHDLPTSTLYGVFTAQDGHLAIAAQADEAWRALARHIGGEALAADARFADMAARNANRLELLPIVRAWTATRPVAQILAELDALDVPCAKVQDIAEVINDPQIAARGMLITQQHPKLGTIRMPNLPFHFSGFDMGVPDCAPSLGQHNREIAADLGFAPHEIDAMQRDGVLHSEN